MIKVNKVRTVTYTALAQKNMKNNYKPHLCKLNKFATGQ